MMPNLDSTKKEIDQTDTTLAQFKTPNDLASQLRIMEELGKTCRETPISIMESDSLSFVGGLVGSGPKRDST